MDLIKKYKKDILLLGVFILTGLGALVLTHGDQRMAETVYVTVDSKEYASFPVGTDMEITIPGYEGGKNSLTIKKGAVSITDADCPDKLCVKSGEIKYSGQTIICLPHRVVVRLK